MILRAIGSASGMEKPLHSSFWITVHYRTNIISRLAAGSCLFSTNEGITQYFTLQFLYHVIDWIFLLMGHRVWPWWIDC